MQPTQSEQARERLDDGDFNMHQLTCKADSIPGRFSEAVTP